MAKNSRHRSTENSSRRSVLKSMGASGAGLAAMPTLTSLTDVQIFGTATATTGSVDDTSKRLLVIKSTEEIEYEFTVTGLLSEVDAPSDAVESGTGSAVLADGRHEFSFTGEFTAFGIEGDATVTVDGESFEYETFPHNTLEIIADGTVNYDVSATGAVELNSDDAERPTNRSATGTISAVSGSGLTSYGSGSSSHTLSYAGELTYLDIEGDVTVIDNGTEIDPTRPVPTIEPRRAQIESFGTEREYYLHLGWDVTAEDGDEMIDKIKHGIAYGTATSQPTAFSFSGIFQFVEIPEVGAIKNDPENDSVECLSLNDDGVSITVTTADGLETTFATESDELETFELDGQITNVRVEAANQQEPAGVELNLEPGVTPDAAIRAKKLQLAASLERESEFEPLSIHAEADGGRIRQDSGGITAFRVATAGDTGDKSQRDLYAGARYELTDIDGPDFESVRLAKNTTISEVEEAQVIRRFRTAEDVPQGVEVGQLIDEDSEEADRLTTHSTEEHSRETIRLSEISGSLRTHSVESDKTALRKDALEYDRNQDVTELEIHGISGIIDEGTDVVVDTVDSGISVTLSGIGTFSDWNYLEGNFQGFSDRGSRALNNAFNSASPFVTALSHFGESGEVDNCSACIATGLVAVDVGVGKASTAGCAAITGGVGTLGCALFFNTLADLIAQHGAEEGLQRACEEASLC